MQRLLNPRDRSPEAQNGWLAVHARVVDCGVENRVEVAEGVRDDQTDRQVEHVGIELPALEAGCCCELVARRPDVVPGAADSPRRSGTVPLLDEQ